MVSKGKGHSTLTILGSRLGASFAEYGLKSNSTAEPKDAAARGCPLTALVKAESESHISMAIAFICLLKPSRIARSVEQQREQELNLCCRGGGGAMTASEDSKWNQGGQV